MQGKIQELKVIGVSKLNPSRNQREDFFLCPVNARLSILNEPERKAKSREMPCVVLENGKIFLLGPEVETKIIAEDDYLTAEKEKLRLSGIVKLSREERIALGLECVK